MRLRASSTNLILETYSLSSTESIKTSIHKNKKLLWHGSRNENWMSIISNGLILNPNAVITGKMFGQGIYFAPKSRKSFGYTSYDGSYWARGNSKRNR